MPREDPAHIADGLYLDAETPEATVQVDLVQLADDVLWKVR